ncbi:MAG: hypothetical protein Q9209_007895 [Squamulea sp. 1 TL-2023]
MDNRNIPPDGHGMSSEQATQPISTSAIASALTTSLAPSPENTRPSQQTRRLQLRNAGFRGQSLPSRRISPIWTCSVRSPEPFGRVVNDENSPNTLEKRLAYGEDLPPNPVSILQELNNSARRRRHPSDRSIGAIFQDNTATAPANENSPLSWYSETSNSNTPLQPRESSISIMKLRDVSFCGRTPPPLSSPLAKQTKSRNGNRVHHRTTSAEATKYIEHLESQLVAVNTKLDSLMSPTSHRARAAKLRALTTEARSLRQQLSEWEQKFDERVQDERNQLAEVEMTLSTRLQVLEDEVELKDNRVRDLEWQMESLKAQVKNAEGLEAVNADLERRIEFLTNLVVQSPTKLELCSAASSPSKADPRKRIAPTGSMMPRVPPSPGSKRLSLNIGPDMYRYSRRSFGPGFSPVQSPGTTPGLASRREQDISESFKKRRTSSSIESGNSSSSFRSPPASSSRPTSLHSNGSFGAFSWGLPLPPEPDAHAKPSHKQRRMRRFPSGGASLKPLILPTAAGTPSLPASAPIATTHQESPQRDFSYVSIDPTVAFLSAHEFDSPTNTPTQPGRRRSTSVAQRETLTALEGRSSPFVDKDDVSSIQSPRSYSDDPLETVEEESSDARPAKKERPRSLGEELAEAGLLSVNSIDDGPIPYSDQSTENVTMPEVDPANIDALQSCLLSPQRHLRESTESETTPRTRTSPFKLHTPSPKSVASTDVATRHAYGLFTRLKGLILSTKQDPSDLARRLIYNAWVVGMAKLGGMGWWLLGLVYGKRWRKKNRVADVETTVEEVPAPSSDWHHISPGSDGRKASEPYERRHLSNNAQTTLGILNPLSRTLYATPDPSRHGKAKDPLILRHDVHLVPCPECEQHWSRRSLRLWFRFSLAIVLAVGLAIKDGPGSVLEGCHTSDEQEYKRRQSTTQGSRSSSAHRAKSIAKTTSVMLKAHNTQRVMSTPSPSSDNAEEASRDLGQKDIAMKDSAAPSQKRKVSRLTTYTRDFERTLIKYNIEARGVRRVLPHECHTLTWRSYLQPFFLWSSVNLAAQNVTLGMLGPALFTLSFRDASLCAFFGSLIGATGVAYITTFGPISGNRTLIFARYTFGWYPSKLLVILNLIVLLGYSMIDLVIAGQILSAVSVNDSMSIVVGIIVVAIIGWLITTFGISIFHTYQRYAFIPQLIAYSILYGVSSHNYDLSSPSQGDNRTVIGSRISFLSLTLAAAITYGGTAADYFVYYPPTTVPVALFSISLISLLCSFTFTYCIGIGLASGITAVPAYSTAYNKSQGALIVAGFTESTSPGNFNTGFGKFLSVVVALGLVANLALPTYSSGIDFQVLGKNFQEVPRVVWNSVGVVVYTVCALAGRGHLAEIFTNFLALMGYWVIIWMGITLQEQLLFRSRFGFKMGIGERGSRRGWGQSYDWTAWDQPSNLPYGTAAFIAFLVGWAGAILCMAQYWYIGPIAKLIGEHGADMGNFVGLSWALITNNHNIIFSVVQIRTIATYNRHSSKSLGYCFEHYLNTKIKHSLKNPAFAIMRVCALTPVTLLLLSPLTHAYTGDMTYYDPGMGSCGISSGPNDDVVALSVDTMKNSANPNANFKCGSWIGIWNPYTKKKYSAKIVDTCQACKKGDIDVSPALFKKIAPNGNGRVHGINWGGERVGG